MFIFAFITTHRVKITHEFNMSIYSRYDYLPPQNNEQPNGNYNHCTIAAIDTINTINGNERER